MLKKRDCRTEIKLNILTINWENKYLKFQLFQYKVFECILNTFRHEIVLDKKYLNKLHITLTLKEFNCFYKYCFTASY